MRDLFRKTVRSLRFQFSDLRDLGKDKARRQLLQANITGRFRELTQSSASGVLYSSMMIKLQGERKEDKTADDCNVDSSLFLGRSLRNP